MRQSAMLPRVTALTLLGMSGAGCEVVGGIFKAGVWVGALAVVTVIVIVVFALTRMRG